MNTMAFLPAHCRDVENQPSYFGKKKRHTYPKCVEFSRHYDSFFFCIGTQTRLDLIFVRMPVFVAGGKAVYCHATDMRNTFVHYHKSQVKYTVAWRRWGWGSWKHPDVRLRAARSRNVVVEKFLVYDSWFKTWFCRELIAKSVSHLFDPRFAKLMVGSKGCLKVDY